MCTCAYAYVWIEDTDVSSFSWVLIGYNIDGIFPGDGLSLYTSTAIEHINTQKDTTH